MNREEKAALVEEIAEQLGGAEAIFAVDYRGISVTQAAELRTRLRDSEARFRVVKNRLTKRAAEKAGRDELVELLQGPVALALVHGDTAGAAKALRDLGREWDLLEFKGGVMDGEVVDPDQFTRIASLPGADVLRGQFVGVLASPLTGLVRGLGSMISGLAIQLRQIEEQGLVSGTGGAAEEEEEPRAEGGEGADAPVEEEPTESSAEVEPQPQTPSQAEGGDEPAGGDASEQDGASEETSDQAEEEERE